MRKPPTRKYVIILLGLVCIIIFAFNSSSQNITFAQSFFDFLSKIVSDADSWRQMGVGESAGGIDTFLFAIAGGIIVLFLVTNAGRRSLKRFFIAGEPDEEYYRKDREIYRGKIKVEGLDDYDPFLRNLAKAADIKEIVFRYNPEITIRTVERAGYVSVVEIGDGFCTGINKIGNPTLRTQFVRFAVYHELMHAKYHDPMNTIWLQVLSIIIWTIGLIAIGFSSIPVIIRFLTIFIWVVFVSALARPGYWSQCAEYRADRGALELLSLRGKDEEIDNIFIAFSNSFSEMTKETRLGIVDVLKHFDRMFIGGAATSDATAHPSISQRQRYAMRCDTWGIKDYCYVAIQTMKRVVQNDAKGNI